MPIKNHKDVSYNKELEGKFLDIVEPGILDLVVVLNKLGFKTSASCEGHNLGRLEQGPYVLIDCQDKEDLKIKKGRIDDILRDFYKARKVIDDRNRIQTKIMHSKEPKFKIEQNFFTKEPNRKESVYQNIYIRDNLEALQKEFLDFRDFLQR